MTKSQEAMKATMSFPKVLMAAQENKGVSSNPSTGLAPNGTFSLWQMLMAIMKYEKVNLDTNAKLQQDFAESLGGKNGFFAHLYDIGVAVGEHQAQGIRDEAYGQFAQAGVAGASFLYTAASYKMQTSPKLNEANKGIEDMGNMDKAIQKGAGLDIGEMPEGELDADVQGRLTKWSNGSIDGFKSADADENLLNQKAAAVASRQPEHEDIMKNVQSKRQSFESQRNAAETEFNTRTQRANMIQNSLGTAGQGAANMFKANEAVKQAQQSAANTIVSQVQQQLVELERKEEQNAEAALQQMNQSANSFAQAAASQVHA